MSGSSIALSAGRRPAATRWLCHRHVTVPPSGAGTASSCYASSGSAMRADVNAAHVLRRADRASRRPGSARPRPALRPLRRPRHRPPSSPRSTMPSASATRISSKPISPRAPRVQLRRDAAPGPITKAGHSRTRWLLIQAAVSLLRRRPPQAQAAGLGPAHRARRGKTGRRRPPSPPPRRILYALLRDGSMFELSTFARSSPRSGPREHVTSSTPP